MKKNTLAIPYDLAKTLLQMLQACKAAKPERTKSLGALIDALIQQKVDAGTLSSIAKQISEVDQFLKQDTKAKKDEIKGLKEDLDKEYQKFISLQKQTAFHY